MSTQHEAAFQHHLATTQNYFAAVRAAGHLPWFEDPVKLAELETRLPGIAQTPGEPARRRLFMKNRKSA
ncbi:hypothetical protein BH11ACT6_BH11ACT6_29810 [soil metagenome]